MEIGNSANPIGIDNEEIPRIADGDATAADGAVACTQDIELAEEPAGTGYSLARPAAAAVLNSFVAVDPVSIRLVAELPRIAASASTVVVRGETGVGKDAVAALVHYLGPHPEEPFLRLDCLSIPRDLIDTELFGCDPFAGTNGPKRGRLELAAGGTVVLDEVAALPLSVQARLLRVIEEKRFERRGGSMNVPVGARIVALSSVDLECAVARRTFREDLYYRLNIAPILVPPLRERPADIRPLADAFLARLAEIHRKPYLRFSPAARQVLESYAYPGNVRELRQLVLAAVACAKGPEITDGDLPGYVRETSASVRPANLSLEQVEREHIVQVLHYTRGKKTTAAKVLGISRKTLLEKRKRYGLL